MQHHTFLRKFAVWILCALAFAPLVVTKSLFFPYISGKSIVIRIAVTVAMGLFAIVIARNAMTKQSHDKKIAAPAARNDGSWRLRAAQLFKNKTFLFVCGYMLVLIVSTIFAVNPYRAFFGDVERAEGLLTMLYLFGFFGLAGILFERADWLRFFQATLITGFVLFVHEIIQLMQGADRPASFTGNPIYLAAVFLFVLFAAWEIFRAYRGAWNNRRGADFFWLAFASLMLPLSVLGIFVTQTRGVMAGLVVGIVATLIYISVRNTNPRIRTNATNGNEIAAPSARNDSKMNIRRWALYGLGVVVLVGTVFVATSQSAFWKHIPGFDRLSQFSFSEDITLRTRLISLGVSLRSLGLQSGAEDSSQATEDEPAPLASGGESSIKKFLVGWGPENFSIAYNAHYNPEYFKYEQQWFDRAHNKLMDVLVMNGVLGLAAYLGIWIALLWAIFRREFSWESASLLFFGAGYFTQNLFAFDSIVTYIPFFAFLAYAIYCNANPHLPAQAGMHPDSTNRANDTHKTQFADQNHNPSSSPYLKGRDAERGHAHAWLPWVAGAFFLLFFIGLIWWTAVPFSQMRQYTTIMRTQALTEPTLQKIGNLLQKQTYAQEVMQTHFLSVLSDSYRSGQGIVKDETMLFAIGAMERFLEQQPEPRNPRHYTILGEAYDALGNDNPQYYAKAEAAYRKALQLAPRRQGVRYMIGYDLAFQQKHEEAIAFLEETVALDPEVPLSHFYLGMVLMVDGQYDRALDEFMYCRGLEEFSQRQNFVNAVLFLERHYQETGDAERLEKVRILKEEI
jgi:tetratricopeptide (TPR) repeat protein/uncharacterized membrane protein (DUF2068 family)